MMRSKGIRKVLMTADSVGGVWSYTLELSRALGFYDIEVFIATMGGLLSESQKQEASLIDNIVVAESDYSLEWMDDPWQDVLRAGQWLMEIQDSYHPDIIHLNNYAHGSLDWKVPVLIVGHSCVYSWFDSVEGSLPPPKFEIYKDKVAKGLMGASRVTAPSSEMMKCLKKFYGNFNADGVIYNGRNADDYLPSVKQPFVFSAARLWDKAKNAGKLASASSRILWPVFLAGDPVHPEGGSSEFENVNFCGLLGQKEVAKIMSRASIYVLPAKYEPFGLSVLEAALSGCTLILGDIPSLREIWDDNAVFVPPDDEKILSETINYLIDHKDYRYVMAEKARRKAFNYSTKKMAEKYLALYEELI